MTIQPPVWEDSRLIPLRDENPTQSPPVITVLLILLNCLFFGYELSLLMESTEGLNRFIGQWGFVPETFTAGNIQGLVTMFTSMFLHGGYLHLGSNMLFLWVFGDNIEDELGSARFLLFYLVCGVAGALGQYVVAPNSTVPLIGASGAIAGVLGAYFLLYPTARVLTAVIFVIFIRLIYLPAWILLGFWIFLQLLQGTVSLGASSPVGNVAWFAHLGGFLAGAAMIFFFRLRRLRT